MAVIMAVADNFILHFFASLSADFICPSPVPLFSTFGEFPHSKRQLHCFCIRYRWVLASCSIRELFSVAAGPYIRQRFLAIMASLTKSLLRIPVPLFGTAASAFTLGVKKATAAPRYAMWALPGAAGAMWFIWPAVSDEFKISIGMLPDPEAEAASSSADASASKAPAVAPAVELSEEAQEKVENAYKSHDQIVEEKMSDEEKAVLKAVEKGDLSALDNDWDEFMTKAIKPGEDDDDDVSQ